MLKYLLLPLLALSSFGQTLPNATPLPLPEFQFLDSNGDPLAGGLLYTYAAGTSTPQATYTDSTAGTQNTNPIVLDSAGRASIWIGASGYKLILRDSAGVQQWSQDNVIDTVLYFVNYVKNAGTATLITYDPPNGQPQTTVAAELTALTTSPFINLKLNCGAKGDGITNDAAVITSCLANNSIVYAPPGTYCTQTPLVIPNKTQLLGAGRGDSGGPNTVFKACAGFPINSAVISLCSTPGPCFGVQVENLTIDCNGIGGCTGGYNAFSEEQSWFRRVLFANAPNRGLWIDGLPPYGGGPPTYAQQNSGPYSDLEILPGASGGANTYCIHVTLSPAWRGLADITCNGVGYSVIPTNAILLEGVSPGVIQNIHIEHFTNGIVLGSATYGVSDMLITNIETGPDNATSVLIPAAPAGKQNITLVGIANSTGGSNVVVDNCNSHTLSAVTAGSGFYATGYGACGSQTVISTRQDTNVNFQTAVNVLKSLTVPGTGTLADDGKICFGVASPYCLYAHESGAPGTAGPVLKTTTTGILVQNNLAGTPGVLGGGLSLNGNCYTGDAAFAQIGSGMSSDCGTFTARAAQAAFFQFLDGNIKFYSDTGLTPGNIYVPTLRFQWTTTGHFQVESGGTYSFNGNNGFTGVKVAGGCTLTIQAGIITNVTGC